MAISENEKIISLHIEKAAGTSFKRFLKDYYPQHLTWFYYPGWGDLYRADQDSQSSGINYPILYTIRNTLMSINIGKKVFKLLHNLRQPPVSTPFEYLIKNPDSWRVLHGHLYIHNVFPKELLENARLVTVLREPFARAKSHYIYYLKMMKGTKKIPLWMDNVDCFGDFIKLPKMINFQQKALMGIPLESFNPVGITDHLNSFCMNFDPAGNISVGRLNSSAEFPDEDFNNFKDEFETLNLVDYSLWNQACQRAGYPEQIPEF